MIHECIRRKVIDIAAAAPDERNKLDKRCGGCPIIGPHAKGVLVALLANYQGGR
jgi:hypothetical protein